MTIRDIRDSKDNIRVIVTIRIVRFIITGILSTYNGESNGKENGKQNGNWGICGVIVNSDYKG